MLLCVHTITRGPCAQIIITIFIAYSKYIFFGGACMYFTYSQPFWFTLSCFRLFNGQNVSLNRKLEKTHTSKTASWTNIISSCYEAQMYTNQTTKRHHHLVNNGHYSYEAHKLKEIHRNGDLVIPSGFTALLQFWSPSQHKNRQISNKCLRINDQIDSKINQTISFIKWFCNTKHLCKNI